MKKMVFVLLTISMVGVVAAEWVRPLTSTNDTLSGLSCANGEIAKYNSTSTNWECEADETGGGGGNQWNISTSKYLYNDSGVLEVNETELNDTYVNVVGDTMTGQLVVQTGNGQIVTSNSAGGIDVQTSGAKAGSISFGNTADIGISQDGVSGGYDYDGGFIFKQKTSNPDEIGEFIFIEENGNWRFALPSSGADYGTYNPRSMIISGPSVNNASNFECSYWGFDNLDCDTSGTGADLGVQDDLEVLGLIYGDGSQLTGITSGLWTNSSGNATYTAGNVGIGTSNPSEKLVVALASNERVFINDTSSTTATALSPNNLTLISLATHSPKLEMCGETGGSYDCGSVMYDAGNSYFEWSKGFNVPDLPIYFDSLQESINVIDRGSGQMTMISTTDFLLGSPLINMYKTNTVGTRTGDTVLNVSGDLYVSEDVGIGTVAPTAVFHVNGVNEQTFYVNHTKTGNAFYGFPVTFETEDSYVGGAVAFGPNLLTISATHSGAPTGTHYGLSPVTSNAIFEGNGTLNSGTAFSLANTFRSSDDYTVKNLRGLFTQLSATGGAFSGNHSVPTYTGYEAGAGTIVLQTFWGSNWTQFRAYAFGSYGGPIDNVVGFRADRQTLGVNNAGFWASGDGEGADTVYGEEMDARIYWDGTNLMIDTNASGENGLAYFSNNISTTGVIERTPTLDNDDGDTLTDLKPRNEMLDAEGKLNRTNMLEGEAITMQITDKENCEEVHDHTLYCYEYQKLINITRTHSNTTYNETTNETTTSYWNTTHISYTQPEGVCQKTPLDENDFIILHQNIRNVTKEVCQTKQVEGMATGYVQTNNRLLISELKQKIEELEQRINILEGR